MLPGLGVGARTGLAGGVLAGVVLGLGLGLGSELVLWFLGRLGAGRPGSVAEH